MGVGQTVLDQHALVARAAFEAGAEAWDAYAGSPRGSLREELISYHLVEHLRRCTARLRVLDVGAGTGGYALRLAQAGHSVLLTDLAPAMLDLARRRFALAGAQVLARASFCPGSVEDLPDEMVDERFDVLLVHTVLEYTQAPWTALSRLLGLLAPGGVISCVIANAQAEVLRLGLIRRDPAGALRALASESHEDELFGLERRSLDLAEAQGVLRAGGIEPLAHYGIRVFADSYSAEDLAREDLRTALIALELAAGGREPFRQIGRYHQLVGARPSDREP